MTDRPPNAAPPAARPAGAPAAPADERYRPLFALAPQPAWVYDTATLRFLEVNDAALRSYGWTREEFLALTLRDIRPPTELDRLQRQLAETREGERHAAESIHRTKTGALRWVEISSYPLEFDGHDARMVLIQDLTERYAAAEALEESERKYRLLIEQLQDVFFRTDERGHWNFLNPAWSELTGYSIETSLGTLSLGYVHPSDRAAMLDAIRPLEEGTLDSSVVEVRCFRKDGGYRWVEARTHSVRDENGRLVGTTGTLRDVTDSRAADAERERLATNVRQLLDAAGEGILGNDTHGVITFINRRGSELLGYEPSELVGRPMHATTHYSRADGTPYPAAECPILRAATQGIPCTVEDEVFWRKDGVALQVEYAASPVRDKGRLTGVVVNFRDISARKRAELELIVARDAAEAANRAKSDFLARMSHELRTPLNSIIGFANILLKNKQGGTSEADLSFLGRIATNGRHLLGLINDILDISKIEAGHMTLELAPVMLDTLVRDTVDEIEGHTRERPVRLRAELPERLEAIETDEARMRQVLVNLIGNALKFTEQGEVVVRLATDPSGRPTHLEVRDTGIGIPADRLDAIFNAFEQAESMINRRFGGTGLGLAISRSLCELMGYQLDVASVEGEGTTMTVVFGESASAPRRRTPGTVAAVTPSRDRGAVDAPDATGHSILVVDDDLDSRMLLASILEESGARIVLASSGVDALRLAREIRPSLIFLDLRLPRISGFDVLRILEADEALRDTPVVIASVVATESRSALASAAAILDKPLERATVFDVLRRFLPTAAR
jgi:PAS domain S-box-containing protein